MCAVFVNSVTVGLQGSSSVAGSAPHARWCARSTNAGTEAPPRLVALSHAVSGEQLQRQGWRLVSLFSMAYSALHHAIQQRFVLYEALQVVDEVLHQRLRLVGVATSDVGRDVTARLRQQGVPLGEWFGIGHV